MGIDGGRLGGSSAAGALEFGYGLTPHPLGGGDGAVERFETGKIGIKHFGEALFFHEFSLELVIVLKAEPGARDLHCEQRLFGGRGLVRAEDFGADL